MRRKPVRLLVAVLLLLVIADHTRGFEHLKHKFKLKKLAKLAFAAKLLTPHLIPLPIPFPIMRRHRHKQHIKVIEEEDPWRGQGWEMGGDVGGGGGWEFNASPNEGGWNFESGWQRMQGWQPQMANFAGSGWSSQQAFGGHDSGPKVIFQEERIPSLKGGHDGGGHGGGNGGGGGQHSHQIEIREEIVPALRAAGFVGDPNGVMMKLQHAAESGNAAVWDETTPDFAGSAFMAGHPQAGAPRAGSWSPPQQTHVAEVHEIKEIKDATIVERPPFDVQNEKLGHFDVSGVPIQPIRAPRQRTQIDPWPQNVADNSAAAAAAVATGAGAGPGSGPGVHDSHNGNDNDDAAVAVRNYFRQGLGQTQRHPQAGRGIAGFEDVRVNDKLFIGEERHQAQDSQSHANVSPDTPYSARPFPQYEGHPDWQPMATSTLHEEGPSMTSERDAHKRS